MSLIPTLRESALRAPAKAAVICGERSWSYAEFDQITDTVAANLVAGGVQPGDRVALHLFNGFELALSYIACFKARAIAVPINTRFKGPEIDYVLRHSACVCYIGQPELFCEVAAFWKRWPSLSCCYLTGGAPNGEKIRPFDDLLRSVHSTLSFDGIPNSTTAAILYTSGTTARPKGVTHSHQTLAETAKAMRGINLDENQIVLVVSSMAHMIGTILFLCSLLNGATFVLLPQIEPRTVLQAFQRHRCTYTVGLPTTLLSVAQFQITNPHDVSSGRFFYCGGDSVSAALCATFQRAMGCPLIELYGCTEGAPLTSNPQVCVRVGSIGQAIPGVRIRLLDAAGCDAAPGQVGELCFQSQLRTTGYWEDPEATAAALREGWFHTGDLVRCDADGYYWFAGRSKQIIVRGGSNISPQEVEAALQEHLSVREVAVIGRLDPVWGEKVVAYAVRHCGKPLTKAELIACACSRIASYKVPEDVIFLEALPRTPTGKLDRRALREADQLRCSQALTHIGANEEVPCAAWSGGA
jgi:long-chain acyl-CoA synthetase